MDWFRIIFFPFTASSQVKAKGLWSIAERIRNSWLGKMRLLYHRPIFIFTAPYIIWYTSTKKHFGHKVLIYYFLFLFQHILLARCKGFCSKSKTEPRVTFSPVLYRPFNYHCKCCRDSLSIMKAVSLNCEGDKPVFATYRYILKCKCRNCNFRRW